MFMTWGPEGPPPICTECGSFMPKGKCVNCGAVAPEPPPRVTRVREVIAPTPRQDDYEPRDPMSPADWAAYWRTHAPQATFSFSGIDRSVAPKLLGEFLKYEKPDKRPRKARRG